MKIFGILIILLFTFPLHAACKCNCDPIDRRLCAPSYDLDNPCKGICPAHIPNIPPSRTACPTQQVYIPATGTTEWVTICFD